MEILLSHLMCCAWRSCRIENITNFVHLPSPTLKLVFDQRSTEYMLFAMHAGLGRVIGYEGTIKCTNEPNRQRPSMYVRDPSSELQGSCASYTDGDFSWESSSATSDRVCGSDASQSMLASHRSRPAVHENTDEQPEEYSLGFSSVLETFSRASELPSYPVMRYDALGASCKVCWSLET